MIEEIKQIIADNSEEKHFVEYGKGVFATEDAVDEIAVSVVKLFSIHNVSQQRELLLAYTTALRENFIGCDVSQINHRDVDWFLEANNCG